MNERILELADEAGIKFSAHWAHEGVDTAVIIRRDLKEFAELIVRECMSNLYLHGYDDAAKCLQDIHFGIEDPV